MHDIVRELSWKISKQECFCMIYSDEEAEWIEARRLSVQKGINDLDPQRGMSNVRSFLVFDMTSFSLKSWISRSTSCRFLRVLDLEGVPIETLRYLGLRGTLVKELPRSLGRLRNLQTLDLYDTKIEKLPHGITQLKNLRHLFVWRIHERGIFERGSGVKAPKGIWNLKNLQTLNSVEADEDMVRHMGNLTQLRTLRITKVRGMHSVELCSSISKMSRLVKLEIAASDELGEALQLEALKPPSYLYQKLFLIGHLEHGVLPRWFSSLAGLRYLGLFCSRLREDPVPCLHALHNLASLVMYDAYDDGRELCFRAGEFPKLKALMLGALNQLDSIIMQEGALPSLSELFLLRCIGMKLLPQGIEHLTSLQGLFLVEMPEEFIERIRGGNGNMEERQKVRHIPQIMHAFQSGDTWTSEILS